MNAAPHPGLSAPPSRGLSRYPRRVRRERLRHPRKRPVVSLWAGTPAQAGTDSAGDDSADAVPGTARVQRSGPREQPHPKESHLPVYLSHNLEPSVLVSPRYSGSHGPGDGHHLLGAGRFVECPLCALSASSISRTLSQRPWETSPGATSLGAHACVLFLCLIASLSNTPCAYTKVASKSPPAEECACDTAK